MSEWDRDVPPSLGAMVRNTRALDARGWTVTQVRIGFTESESI